MKIDVERLRYLNWNYYLRWHLVGTVRRRRRTHSTTRRKNQKIQSLTKQWISSQTSFVTRSLKSRLLGLRCSRTLLPNDSLKHTCLRPRQWSLCRRWWSTRVPRKNSTELWRFKVSMKSPKLAHRSNLPSTAEELPNGVYQRYSQWQEKVLSSSRDHFARNSNLPWVDSRERHAASQGSPADYGILARFQGWSQKLHWAGFPVLRRQHHRLAILPLSPSGDWNEKDSKVWASRRWANWGWQAFVFASRASPVSHECPETGGKQENNERVDECCPETQDRGEEHATALEHRDAPRSQAGERWISQEPSWIHDPVISDVDCQEKVLRCVNLIISDSANQIAGFN